MVSYRELILAVQSVKERPEGLAGDVLDKARLQALREAPHLQGLVGEIHEEAVKAGREPLPELTFGEFHKFASVGTRRDYEKPYFERRGRLLALVLASLLEDTDAYMETLENVIWAICGEYAWAVPAHLPSQLEQARTARLPMWQVVDLFAAETAHALAETLYLLEDRLNPWVADRIREELERRVYQPLFNTPHHFHWEAVTNNWSAVCAGAVGMAALLTVDNRERLAGMLDRVVRAMESFLAGYGEDGCCPEGIGYWSYGFGYYVFFAEMLHTYTGGEIDLLQGEKIRRIAEFPTGIALTSPQFVNFSDASESYIVNPGMCSRLTKRLGVTSPPLKGVRSFHQDHCYRWPQLVRMIVWTDPAHISDTVKEGSYYYPDTEWLIDKRNIQGHFIAFAAKGGHNDEPHNHNDLGHFIVHAGGDNLLSDLGAGLYTKDYFGPLRYTLIHNSAEGHSIPLVNGIPQSAGSASRAKVAENEEAAGRRRFGLELGGAYPEEAGLQAFQRSFVWSTDASAGQARLELTDAFRFVGANNTVEELFISFYEPSIEANGKRIVWRGSGGEASLELGAIQGAASVERIETTKHLGEPVNVYRTRIVVSELGSDAELTFLLRVEGGGKPA